MKAARKTNRFLAGFLALTLALVLGAGVSAIPAYAANGKVYTCQIVPCYAHPVTGVIEDSGGEASYATGQGMVESAVYTTGIIEVMQDGNYYLTIRLSLMDYTSNHSFWVQNVGDSNWSTPALGVTATGTDSNGTTTDVCIQVPSENCVVRGGMYVEPMGRDVIFYLYPTNYSEGNSTNMVSTMIVEDTPVQNSGVTAEQSQTVQTEAAQTEASAAETEVPAEVAAVDASALAETAMEEARGLRMSMDLESAKEETGTSAEGLKIVAASAKIAQICDKLDLELAGVCAEDASQVPERYADVVITEADETALLDAVAALEPDWLLDAASKRSTRQDAYDELSGEWAFLNLDSVAGMYRSISELGEIFGRTENAQVLTEEYAAFLGSHTAEEANGSMLVLIATKDGCKAAADSSYLGDLIRLAGNAGNVYTGTEDALVSVDKDTVMASGAGIILRASEGLTAEETENFWTEFASEEEWSQTGTVFDLDNSLFGADADLSYQEALTALQELL